MEWQDRYGVYEADLREMQAAKPMSPGYLQMMADLEGYANLAYRKAWEAIPTLSWRFGPSVAVAAEVYRGIHGAIRRNGQDNLTLRAYTSTPRKVMAASRALLRFSVEKAILSLQAFTPSRIQLAIKSLLEKARMTWMVPFLFLALQAAIIFSI